jgi:hypothetical protein
LGCRSRFLRARCSAWWFAAAGDELLDTYQTERRPTGVLAGEQARPRQDFHARFGIETSTNRDDPRRQIDSDAVMTAYRYSGSPVATLTGQIGTRLPHAWLRDGVSTLDLIGSTCRSLTRDHLDPESGRPATARLDRGAAGRHRGRPIRRAMNAGHAERVMVGGAVPIVSCGGAARLNESDFADQRHHVGGEAAYRAVGCVFARADRVAVCGAGVVRPPRVRRASAMARSSPSAAPRAATMW